MMASNENSHDVNDRISKAGSKHTLPPVGNRTVNVYSITNKHLCTVNQSINQLTQSINQLTHYNTTHTHTHTQAPSFQWPFVFHSLITIDIFVFHVNLDYQLLLGSEPLGYVALARTLAKVICSGSKSINKQEIRSVEHGIRLIAEFTRPIRRHLGFVKF